MTCARASPCLWRVGRLFNSFALPKFCRSPEAESCVFPLILVVCALSIMLTANNAAFLGCKHTHLRLLCLLTSPSTCCLITVPILMTDRRSFGHIDEQMPCSACLPILRCGFLQAEVILYWIFPLINNVFRADLHASFGCMWEPSRPTYCCADVGSDHCCFWLFPFPSFLAFVV